MNHAAIGVWYNFPVELMTVSRFNAMSRIVTPKRKNNSPATG
jgi:hypothetical protein